MTRRAAIAGLILGAAALAAHAAEPAGAPLANSKEELRTLQADQATKARPGGKITGNAPDIGAPTPGETPIDLTASIKAEKELKKKKDARKNWLLDGMEQLGQTTKGAGKESRDDAEVKTPADEDKPAEADSLLKLYSEQKKKDEARTEAKTAAVARNDPFAPFLQGWLANAPASGNRNSYEASSRKAEAGGPVGAPGAGEANLNSSAAGAVDLGGVRGYSAPAKPQPNPYLETPAGPAALSDFNAARNSAMAADVGTGPAAPPPNPTLAEPLPASRPPEKKPPFLRPSDNEKYFPQQKKF